MSHANHSNGLFFLANRQSKAEDNTKPFPKLIVLKTPENDFFEPRNGQKMGGNIVKIVIF